MDGANFSISAVGTTLVDLNSFIPDPHAASKLDIDLAKQCCTLPISFDRQRNRLFLATETIHDVLITERIIRSIADSMHVTIGPLCCSSLDDAIEICYSHALEFSEIVPELSSASGKALQPWPDYSHPLIRLVNSVLHAAVDHRASDIHINPSLSLSCRIRFRIDGVLGVWQKIPSTHLAAVAVRIKLLASLDIAESRLPQDGQFSVQIQGRWIDFRVSTFPTTEGENLVLRVLDKRARMLGINELLGTKKQQLQVKTHCNMKDGLTIVCGPTGCGKSTTLLAMLAELDSQSLNIMTLEDPVENTVEGIQQCSIRAAQQLDYTDGVRALLRQDPDVLLIGEIRDSASAAMAFRAALTGHGVFTTIHCRDTQSAMSRLLDLGIGCSGIASCVNVLIAQRLVRRLCSDCSSSKKGQPSAHCHRCNGTGYFGRFAVLEIMSITDSLRSLLCNRATPADIWSHAVDGGLQSLREQIQLMVTQGLTDGAELHRVMGPM
ncbi:MAG: GspE/PulE family protein [Granulosicoccaceae bacterium]